MIETHGEFRHLRHVNQHHQLTQRLIGVIDLQAGLAVRGVGGNRERYRPAQSFRVPGKQRVVVDGDYLKLIQSYRAAGIESFYLADLDAIEQEPCQRSHVEQIVHAVGPTTRVLMDLGITDHRLELDGRWIDELIHKNRNITLVIATECAPGPAILDQVIRRIGRKQLAVSFDYKAAQWCSSTTTDRQWISVCQHRKIETVIGLDLAAVGGDSIESTAALCRRIRSRLPNVCYITGGGIRCAADIQRLIDDGADELLVASLFVS